VAVQNNKSLLTITGSIITGNTTSAPGSGGGIYLGLSHGFATVTNTSITNNSAYLDGGGVEVYHAYSSVYLRDNTVTGNSSGRHGGGIDATVVGNSFTLDGSIVSNNTTGPFDVGGRGGGVFASGVNGSEVISIDTSVITGNVAQQNGDGGGLLLDAALILVHGTTVAGNTAGVGGGVNLLGQATFDNVTITNNTAQRTDGKGAGGGVFADGSVTFTSSTIGGDTTATANHAQQGSGGVEITGSTAKLQNSIVANNTSSGGTNADIQADGATVTSTYSLIKTPGTTTIGDGTGDLTGVDPILAPLADNGSVILAGNPNSGPLHPQTLMPICPNSPVVNAGQIPFAPGMTDERGKPRFAGGRVDMGAVEVQGGFIQFTTTAQSISGDAPGTVTATVTRTGGAEGAVSVGYRTFDSTAKAGIDYVETSGTLSWADGDTASKSFTVPILHDPTYDPDERFMVVLDQPTCSAGDGLTFSEIVTITESVLPTLSINNVSTSEGNGGATPFTFTVKLSEPSTQPTTVDYATANGTAVAGSDYTAASGTLTFNPGVTTQMITVNVTGDPFCEPDETFTVNLSSPTNATIADGTGTGTIVNDDSCSADIGITKTGPTIVYAETPFTYTMAVTNAGPGVANSVIVTDPLPAGTTFVSATPSQGSCSGTTTVTCSLGVLGIGANATIALTVTPATTGPLRNTASVSIAPMTDPNPANNSATAQATVLAATTIPALGERLLMLLGGMLAAIGAWVLGRK